MSPRTSTQQKSHDYGALQELIDSLFDGVKTQPQTAQEIADAVLHPAQVRRLDVVLAAQSLDLPDDLQEIVGLLPPGNYTRQRLCDQLNSAIGGHAWGQRYGTVE